MGYWWYILSTFLHVNVILMLVAVLPFPTPRQWKYILEIRLLRFFFNVINFDLWKLYLAMGCISFILFMDVIRNYLKYSTIEYMAITDPLTRKDAHITLLMAQRNYYICGISYCLCVFFPRLVTILKENAGLATKIESIENASKLFAELIRVIQVERNVRNNGGVEFTILEEMKNELANLHNESGVREEHPQWSDIKRILEIYEQRIARDGRRQQEAGVIPVNSYYHQQSSTYPMTRRRPRTIYSTYIHNPNSWSYQPRANPTRFGPVESD